MATRKMEDGLLHCDLVEWPPVRFFQESHKLYQVAAARRGDDSTRILSLIRSIDIWRSVCKVISQQIMRGRGTKIDGVGLFSLDVNNNPAFFPDPLFKRIYGCGK